MKEWHMRILELLLVILLCWSWYQIGCLSATLSYVEKQIELVEQRTAELDSLRLEIEK